MVLRNLPLPLGDAGAKRVRDGATASDGLEEFARELIGRSGSCSSELNSPG